jgi:hypothetical protein
VAALLVLAVQLFATLAMAQSSTGQNLLRNGDFSDGLTGWTEGVLRKSAYVQYPEWMVVGGVGFSGNGLSAYLDVSGGAAAYLESDPFMLPEQQGAYTLNATFWGTRNPTVLQVEIRTQGGTYVLDSLEPPRVESDQEPIVKDYNIPGNFSGQNIALRFTCADEPSAHASGASCAFADLAVLQLPADNMYSSVAMIAMGLGLAAAGVALAQGASSGSSSSTGSQAKPPAKPGFHFPISLRALALALVGYLSKKYCCACAGTCNHTGPHSFCPAHDPRTLAARMEVVYKVYCRYCGRKLEEHECRGPMTRSVGTPISHSTIEREDPQNEEGSQETNDRTVLRHPP